MILLYEIWDRLDWDLNGFVQCLDFTINRTFQGFVIWLDFLYNDTNSLYDTIGEDTMNCRHSTLVVSVFILGSMLACAAPALTGGQPTLSVADQLAMTVAVELTRVAGQVTQPPEAAAATSAPASDSPTRTPETPAEQPGSTLPPTATLVPSDTLVPTITPTVTKTPIPCNWAEFITDVTALDGTEFFLNTSFTKTWRIKNIGSCTWTSSYRLVFANGERMGAPDLVPFTGGDVPPGSTVDISVDLKTPAAEGTYQGNFRLKAADGTLFGIGATADKSFFVKIKAVKPLADLYITEFSITPATPKQGVPCHVRVLVYNGGKAAAGPFTVAWWGLDSFASPGCTWNLDSMAARGGRVLECDFTFNSWYPTTKTTKVTADTSNTVEESDESNNSKTITNFGVEP
jgi:hypothetical protein